MNDGKGGRDAREGLEGGVEWARGGRRERGGGLTSSARTRRYAARGVGGRERIDENALGTFMFQWESANAGESVFTRENIEVMRAHEALVMERFDEFCQVEYDGDTGAPLGCVTPLTPLSYFYDDRGTLVDDPDVVVRDIFARNLSHYGYFLGAFDAETGVVGITRAKYPVGSPFKGYVSASDRRDEQDAILASFLDPIESTLFENFGMKGNVVSSPYMQSTRRGSLITRWDAELLRQRDSARVISSDLAWAIGSIAAVWLYAVLNTASVFVATVGMFEILVSFPIAIMIYRWIFRIEYVGSIQALSIFICLGIGADDVFVYWDAFRQSAHEIADSGDSLHDRLVHSTGRASKAIFVTSLTTTGAFLATAWSSITPLAGFGILSATMIAVLFVMNVLLFPATLMIYARYFDHMKWLCPSREETCNEGAKRAKLSRIENFFNGPFYRTIERPVVRLVFIPGFIAIFIVASRLCLRLETPSRQEKWYASSHLSQQFIDREESAFMRSDDDIVVHVDIFWGLEGVDTSGISRWDLNARGKLLLETSFDLSSEASQAHIFESCLRIRDAPCFLPGCRDGKLSRNVDCFMEAFRDHVGAVNFPVPQSELVDKLLEFRASPSGSRFVQQMGFRLNDVSGEMELFFVKVTAISTLQLQAPASISRLVHDEYQSLVDKLNEVAPPGVANGLQTAYLAWTWMRMQETLVENTFQGISICFCMAFVILTLSTGNVLVAAIASVAVAGTVVSVLGLGIYQAMGWDLGIRETIAAVILIGLSVDYGIHIGNAYVEAPSTLKTRGERVRYALTTMGVSIVGSAATTVASGSILWLCTLMFFSKFAFLITSTIFSSICWSIFFIPLVLVTLGPEGKDWSLTTLFTGVRVTASRVQTCGGSP